MKIKFDVGDKVYVIVSGVGSPKWMLINKKVNIKKIVIDSTGIKYLTKYEYESIDSEKRVVVKKCHMTTDKECDLFRTKKEARKECERRNAKKELANQ